MKLASFDIFDTALIRKCGHPDNIFELLGRKLFPGDSTRQDDFVEWRRRIGEQIQKATGENDATLDELYAFAEFPPWTVSELINAELAIESENLVANPLVRNQIARFRADGWTISFMSDMYLPAAFLKEMLLREKCAEADDMVWISSTVKARKDNGALYSFVRQKLHPEQWLHFGDNYRSDVKEARKNRVDASLVDSGFTSVEKKIMHMASLSPNGSDLRLLAGFSRTARLLNENTPEAVFAADFVAPTYLSYVMHIAEHARRKGIKRLYFLSRDGYMLKQSMEAAFAEFDMRELYVSRNSLMLPYLSDDFSADAYLKIVDRNTLISRSVSHMLWQLGLNQSEIKRKYQITFEYQTIHTKEQEHDFLEKLFNSRLTSDLRLRAKNQHDLLMQYFGMEKLTDSTPSLLVDIGWIGTTRLMINSILANGGFGKKQFVYFGVRDDVLPMNYGLFSSYFRKGEFDTRLTVLVENYFSQSPNPSVRDYRSDAGRVVPQWENEKEENETMSLQMNRRVLQGMMQYLVKFPFQPQSLHLWAKTALDAICSADQVDFSPLLAVKNFDLKPFVKRFSLLDTILYVAGKQITSFDHGSSVLTWGNRLGMVLEWLHDRSSHILYPIYCRLKSK